MIIIGGSVAGAPTAMLLARHGHRVLLIEKSVFPRDTNSTHFIWPRGVSYLNRWGLAEHILKSTPHYTNMELNIEGISLTGCIPLEDLKQRFRGLHGDDHGVMNTYCGPRRYFLDTYLLDSAKKSGVEVIEGATYKHPIMENNVVTGISANLSDGSSFIAKANIVIAADGRFSKFAKDVNAEYVDYRELSTFAYYGYFSGINREELAIHKRGQFGTAIFPTQNNRQMVLVYGPTALWNNFKEDEENNFFNLFSFCAPDIGELVKKGKRMENFKACGRMPAFQRVSHGRGWALIGDAGSFKDQVTAMGITHAFRDAELMSTFLHRALSNEMSIEDALQQYEQIRKQDYIDYFNLVCKTAEMNPYSIQDLKYYYTIKNNPEMVNQLLSQFGDTLPIHQGKEVTILNNKYFPEDINYFDPDSYPTSFPL